MVVKICSFNQPCAAGLDWLKELYHVVLQERQDPSETAEELTHDTYVTKKTDHI